MRLLHRYSSSCWSGLAVLALASVLAGCATQTTPPPKQAQPVTAGALTDPLRVSDRVKIEITGPSETIPASEQEVSGDGTVRLDLIGDIQAAGKTPGQLGKDIQEALVPKYYAHANVTVAPTGRFFYVGGEIS